MLAAERPFAVPQLFDLEVLSGIRKLALREVISSDEAATMLNRLVLLPLQRHEHLTLLPRVWELHRQLSPYDATYVALAEQLGAVLLTRDARLARAHGVSCVIELVP